MFSRSLTKFRCRSYLTSNLYSRLHAQATVTIPSSEEPVEEIRLKSVKFDDGVNGRYQHDTRPFPQLVPKNNSRHIVQADLDGTKHMSSEPWTVNEMKQVLEHNSMYSWMPGDVARELSQLVSHGDGMYVTDHNGKKYIDFCSGAVCMNLGHTVPREVKQAINMQLDEIAFVYSDTFTVEIRAKLCCLLNQLFPGDLNSFLFFQSGAEANECAIRMARHYTGRHKIMSRHRSYHGGTVATLHLTGDSRTHLVNSPGATGYVKMFDPLPLTFEWDQDQEAATQRCLDLLHEQIIHENPSTIAGIIVESITGTNGWLIPPPGYLQGVRALCDTYGIQLICDEVMVGFGRTGKWFGFQHWPGVMPDIVSFAKGVTSSIQPVSGIAARPHLKECFDKKPMPYGSTFCCHPVGLAAAYANVKYLIKNQIVENAASLQSVMEEEMGKLVNKHQAVKAARVRGLAGGIDLQDYNGRFLDARTVHKFRLRMRDAEPCGLVTLARDHFIHTTPPLNSTADDIRHGFAVIDQVLSEGLCLATGINGG